MADTPTTHDTFVIGIKGGEIVFLKTYDYKNKMDEAQADLKYVQDNYDGYYISHVGRWMLEHKDANEYEEKPFSINIKTPTL